ncbi:hypothetical protein [Planosporangium mesophilum]|uniref:Uncharacterized protein n=1 Tax=Planosporangium mesophilum TaxID=689768 RepID=A0A8J3T861_9ACTN|nr:hypothetical protein [Planosporangium mesophilum]NJC81926.1 hypothetical protein [Planosporangium mesophilum]GII20412.1 hypothetical protein Pme01_00090 [Planosporangium mesophilum]
MSEPIEFFRDEDGFILPPTSNPHFRGIGSWLASDIQTYAPDSLDVLARVEDVRSGRSSFGEWEGNSGCTRFTPTDVTVESLGPRGGETTYTHEEAHSAMLGYWHFLTPTEESKKRALATWEGENEREHPCRPHLWRALGEPYAADGLPFEEAGGDRCGDIRPRG